MSQRLEGNRISGMQFMFCIASFLQASSLLTTFMYSLTGQDTIWVAMASSLIGLALFFVFIALQRGYPGMSLMDMTERSFGRMIGTVFNVLYLCFFLLLSAMNVRFFCNLIQQTILSTTPSIAVAILCMLMCSYGMVRGLVSATRHGSTFTIVSLITLVISLIAVMKLFDGNNFQPMFVQSPIRYVQSVDMTVCFLFGECVVFLMLAPRVKAMPRGTAFYWIAAFVIGVVAEIGSVAREIGVLGNTVGLFTMPFYETLRLIRVTNALSRMELLFALVLINLFFCKIMVLFYATCASLKHVIRQPSHKPYIFLIGAMIVVIAQISSPSMAVGIFDSQEVFAVLWLPFCVILPPLTLLLGKLRRRLSKGEST